MSDPVRGFDERKLKKSFREHLDKLRKMMDLVELKPGEHAVAYLEEEFENRECKRQSSKRASRNFSFKEILLGIFGARSLIAVLGSARRLEKEWNLIASSATSSPSGRGMVPGNIGIGSKVISRAIR